VWDRLFPRAPRSAGAIATDAAVVALALLRVFVPPLPFVSGHALLAGYAALTARRWPLRAMAGLVLGQVVYVKVLAAGGWASMVGGFAVAAILAVARPREPPGR
jgi:hypothetical protein